MGTVTTTVSKGKMQIFQTVLSSPGMNEKCKINLMISRQNILFLSRLFEAGLQPEKNNFDNEIIPVLPRESLQEMK